jgi:hypothetical protein
MLQYQIATEMSEVTSVTAMKPNGLTLAKSKQAELYQ